MEVKKGFFLVICLRAVSFMAWKVVAAYHHCAHPISFSTTGSIWNFPYPLTAMDVRMCVSVRLIQQQERSIEVLSTDLYRHIQPSSFMQLNKERLQLVTLDHCPDFNTGKSFYGLHILGTLEKERILGLCIWLLLQFGLELRIEYNFEILTSLPLVGRDTQYLCCWKIVVTRLSNRGARKLSRTPPS